MNTTIKINDDTRRKLKLLAAMLDTSMINALDGLVDEALNKINNNKNLIIDSSLWRSTK